MNPRPTHRFVALSIAVLVSVALQAQRNQVRLHVVDADSGLPLLRAQVTAASTEPLSPTFSDEHGNVTVDATPAGRSVRVSKPGYVRQQLMLAAASGDIEVRLARAAAVSGRVIDTFGVAVIGRPVNVVSASDRTRAYSTKTNDLGEYRVGGLPEGSYVVALGSATGTRGLAAYFPMLSPEEIRENERILAQRANVEPNAARDTAPDPLPHTITVRRGEEIAGIDFLLAARESCPPRQSLTSIQFAGRTAITGRVTDVRGNPIPCAEVVAFRSGAQTSVATTAFDGSYVLQALRAGTYQLEFRRSGYVTLQWGEQQTGPGRPIVLRDRDQVKGIDIRLPRGGAITGTVVDEAGEPVENVTVRALQLRGEDERPIAVAAGSAQTDDRGRYRLSQLIAGRYIVATIAAPEPSDPRIGKGYAPAYYPGVVDIASAAPVDVTEERERQFTDFARVPARVATVTGFAVNSKNERVTDRVIVVASQRSGAVIAETHGADVKGEEGAFTIPNVPPGDYVVQATSKRGADEPPEFGRVYVTVGENDPLPLRIQTRAGVDVQGRLIEDGVPLADPRSFALTAVPVDWDQTSLLAGTQQIAVDGRGVLSLSGVTGPRRFVLTSAPSDWYLKSVRALGRDVTDDVTGFPMSGLGFMRDLEVVVSNNGATLQGDVTDGTTRVFEYSVLLFSSNPDHWFQNSRFVKATRSNTTGRFRIAAIPDGEYFVVAIDPLDGQASGVWQQRGFLQGLTPFARRIRLREGEAPTLSLSLIHR